ncbi:beta-glucosidase [Niveomyces insectorum RCEF 264]|uniref:beta-glucosidase n=1 Tax=Niveomyces insectorum RCEF 264 TaxID=1081102 RepID=A0A167RY18_9HYPO|nr:beta-glucosidase [Niveomyces insectorum RCEF 264]
MKGKVPFLRTRKGIAITVLTVVLVLGGGLSGLAALRTRHHGHDAPNGNNSNSNAGGVITNDTYFYGLFISTNSLANITGSGSWAISFNKAVALVANMTLAERVNLTAGVPAPNGCSGFVPPVPRLNFSGMCLSDAGNGLRNTDFVSSWPSGIHVGASWNRDLAQQRANGMAAEFKKKGVNVMLGPVVGPAGRTVRSGRYWEGLSVDPYLAGALVYESVTGAQQAGVITSTKHFIGNEQETNRQPSGSVQSVSSNIDDRTMHELYLWPFQDAVYAGSGNIMCSYNRVNNSYGCSNSKTLNGLLKTELGFQGFVVSDWGAQHAGVATALSGMDMAMPNGPLWGNNLVEAVKNGSIPESRIVDMATRIVAAWYQMGQDSDFPTPGIGMAADLTQPHPIVDGRDASAKQTLLDGAIEGHVLLKNANNSLPLKAPKFLSIFGYSARAADLNEYQNAISPWTYGTESANASDTLYGFVGAPPANPLGIAPNGTLFSGGGSGANSQTLVSAPFDAITQQAWTDGTQLFWDFTSSQPSVNPVSDACLVFGNVWASESFDRPSLTDAYTNDLITSVASHCNNTIVVLHNAGVRVVDPWIDHPNVTALLFAHLPGQYSGQALVSILYGTANPSGKLPYTVAKKESDYGLDLLNPAEPADQFANFPQANFTEGVFIDYRRFDANNITPRYEFGYGLSYTTFTYANLQISKASGPDTLFAPYPAGAVQPGGQADLWDTLVTVTANVANTGSVAGAEVAQLYVTLPNAGGGDSNNSNSSSSSSTNSTDTVTPIPVRQLRGFDKPLLQAGQTTTVSFVLRRRDLSVWDVVAQKWLLQPGSYGISVGASSRNLPLQGSFTI